MSESYFLGPAAGLKLNVMGDRLRVLTWPDATDGLFEIFEVSALRGSGPPPHVHNWPEAYFILSGEIEVMVDGESKAVRAGDYVSVPSGKSHSYTVLSEQAKFIAVSAGDAAGHFFADLHANIPTPVESFEAVLDVAARNEVFFR